MPEHLQAFQKTFGTYLRDPDTNSLPEGIDAKRSKIYEDLLFNNVSGFLNSCFPVCRSLISEEQWYLSRRRFFSEWRSHSPYFRDIPHEFLQYLQNSDLSETLPVWFNELAYYEWVELAVDTQDTDKVVEVTTSTDTGNAAHLEINPTLYNLEFEWPVHKISPSFVPEQPEPTFLAVYRTEDYRVQFTELNAATSLLVRIVEQAKPNRQALFESFAELTHQELSDQFLEFAHQTVDNLVQQEILLEY